MRFNIGILRRVSFKGYDEPLFYFLFTTQMYLQSLSQEGKGNQFNI